VGEKTLQFRGVGKESNRLDAREIVQLVETRMGHQAVVIFCSRPQRGLNHLDIEDQVFRYVL